MVVAVIRDLIFVAEVSAVVTKYGLEYRKVRQISDLDALPQTPPTMAVLVDLTLGEVAFFAITKLRQQYGPSFKYFEFLSSRPG